MSPRLPPHLRFASERNVPPDGWPAYRRVPTLIEDLLRIIGSIVMVCAMAGTIIVFTIFVLWVLAVAYVDIRGIQG